MSMNLAECIGLAAEAAPNRTALVFEETRLSYGELARAAQRVANILHAKGIGRGDTVAMMLPNTPHFPMVYFGILYAGATVVPLNFMLRRREILYQLADADARALIVGQEFAEEAAAAFADAEDCSEFILVEPDLQPGDHAQGESFAKLFAQAAETFDMAQTAPEETAVIMYTSATTGNLRGAELSHFNLFFNALVVKEYVLRYTQEDVFLAALPLFHSFGQTSMMNAAFLARSTVICCPRFESGKVFELVARHRVTLLALVPTMYHYLVYYKEDQEFDLSSLRVAIAGGSALPVELAEAFHARFGKHVLEGYGLTETSPVVSVNPGVEGNKPGSIGKPIWGCRVRVVREDGSTALLKETGELVVRGPNVMKGYHNKPEATELAMAGGWFHTGDLAYLDEDGYIFLVGLKKDMILRAGLNVYPREIEEVLQTHPAIEEAGVVGMPDPVRGEEVKAFYVLKPGADLAEKELNAFCRERLAAYKCPRKFVQLPSLPRDSGGRIDKKSLRALPD